MERENLFIQVHNQKLLAESFHINVIQNVIKLWFSATLHNGTAVIVDYVGTLVTF